MGRKGYYCNADRALWQQPFWHCSAHCTCKRAAAWLETEARRLLPFGPFCAHPHPTTAPLPPDRLLSKASEGTFLFDRALPARDESTTGFNVEAGLSALISRRLVDALLSHRQEQADKAQKELEV